jgi:glycosyltransferase involved in cell wall biosynthesis
MRKVALFFNSPYIGGAERSILTQIASLRNSQIDFYIPQIEGVESRGVLEEVKKKFPEGRIFHYQYPAALYKTSRSSSGKLQLVSKLLALVESFLYLRGLGLGNYDVIWTNGNKAALPVYLFLYLFNYSKHFVWHFRDYPHDKGIFKIIWKLLGRRTKFKKTLLANSYSVERELRSVIRSEQCEYQTIYNPVGDIQRAQPESIGNNIKKVGLASMIAPWKGIHTIIHFEKMFRNELKDMGIEEFSVYGGDIYATEGEHATYLKELLGLVDDESLIKFKGNSTPQDIFSSIDLLIHSSLKPEPFGRVIIEAFAARVPVLSTCLGGSGELVIDGESGARIYPYDYVGLLNTIKSLQNREDRKELTDRALSRLDEVEEQQRDFWSRF